MKYAVSVALLLLLVSPLSAMHIMSPPPPGTVGAVGWLHVPGVSDTGSYTVQWGTAMWYAEAYELQEDTNASFTSPTTIYQGTAQTHNVTGRADGTYYYRVRGVNITYGNNGPWLDGDHPHVVDSTLSSCPAVPSAPSSVTVPSSSGSGLIPVSWTAVSGASVYDVQEANRSTTPISPNFLTQYTIVASAVSGSSFTFTGADTREHFFRVRTQVAVGSYALYSLWSASSNGCSVNLLTPGAISTLTVPSSSSSGSYQISWTASSNAASYELEEDTSSSFTNAVQIYSGAAQDFTVTGQGDGTYYYRVRGVNAAYQGSYTPGSNACTVTLGAVGLPSSITVPSGSATGTYTVTWGAASNASSYELQEDTRSDFSTATVVYQGTDLSCPLTGRTNGSYYYRVRGVNAANQGAWAPGGNPCVVAIPGTLTLSAGSQNFSCTVVPGHTGVPVLQIDLVTDAMETITVTALTITGSGTLGLGTGIDRAQLHADVNGDGLLDAGDALLATVSSPGGTSFTFTGLAEALPASASATWLVTCDLLASAPDGETLVASIAQDADVSVTGSVSGSPSVTGCPVTGSTKTTGDLGSLSVLAGAGNPPGRNVEPGETGVPVLQLKLVASSVEDVEVLSLDLTAAGTGDDAAGISGVFLYLDDGDDVFDGALDALLFGPLVFSADDGTLSIPLSQTVSAGAARNYFVVYSFDSGASDGETYGVSLVADADVDARGATTLLDVPVSGAPVSGADFTVRTPAPPSDDDGRCGGGVHGGGPGSLLSWALLAAAFYLCLAAARAKGKEG